MPNRIYNTHIYFWLFIVKDKGVGEWGRECPISKQKVWTLLRTCHILLFQSTIFNPLEKCWQRGPLARNSVKNMQLWGHRHNTDIKLVENAAFVLESAPDKNRNFMENWSQLHMKPDHMPTTEQRFSHCCPRDFSNNRGLIYSILLILKFNPPCTNPLSKERGCRPGFACNR